jgi:hypothetical protein
VELHPGWAQRLCECFAQAPVTVIQTDALSLRLQHRPFRVVASPPYAISSALLWMLLDRVRGWSPPTWCSSGPWCVATSTGGALPQAIHTDGGTRGSGEPFPLTHSAQHHRSARPS